MILSSELSPRLGIDSPNKISITTKEVKMVYEKPETWSMSFIAWHKNFIKTNCDVEKHLEQGCIHCET